MDKMCIGIQTDGNEICDIGWLTFHDIKIHKGQAELPSIHVGWDEIAIEFKGKKKSGQGLILVMSKKDLHRLFQILLRAEEWLKDIEAFERVKAALENPPPTHTVSIEPIKRERKTRARRKA